MFAKINHVAASSQQYALLAKFYETVFGMKSSPKLRSGRAVTVGDGYVGFNINPRKVGRGAGLDGRGDLALLGASYVFDQPTPQSSAAWPRPRLARRSLS